MTTERRCENCYFYEARKDDDTPDFGFCRAETPTIVGEKHTVLSINKRGMAEEVEVEYISGWLEVRPNDWCGKHQYNEAWSYMDDKKGEIN